MAMVSLESCYERVRQFMTQGDYDRAEGVCRHVLQYYPQDLGTFQLLGQINLEKKQGRDARDYFRRVLEIDPENVSAHWGMGIAYQAEGKVEQTIAEFEQALEIKPDLSDLRSQLLRLYTETYGAAQAQLRLSRAGLGRLYAKGGMLDKAIAEFREVLKLDPTRGDVQMSLIDALWQGGRTEEAARVCEEILQRLPDALKANLVLGYVHLLAGRREAAEELWRKAAACDPNNTLARALFETAPQKIPQGVLAFDKATLPDFDEAAWQAQLAAAAAKPAPEVPAAPVPAPAEEPVRAAKPAAVPGAAAPEATSISWLDALATGEGEVAEQEAELVPGVAPFDLGGLDLTGAAAEAAAVAPPPEGEVAPFAVEEKPAALAGPVPVAQEAPAPARAEPPEMRPFALEDLGLSPEEIASLEEAVASTKTGEGGRAAEEALGEEEATLGLQPFSLEDETGLGGEEAAVAGVAPFSLEEATTPGAAAEAGAPGVTPFTLEEAAQGEAVPAGPKGEAAIPGVAPFSLEDVTAPGGAEMPEIPGLEPFSVESLGLEAIPGGAGVPPEMVGELKPFSLEELGLEEVTGEPEPAGMERFREGMGEDAEAGAGAFSWQEAGTSKAPAFRGELGPQATEKPAGGPSLFEKMMATRREPAELGAEAPEVAPPEEVPASEGVAPFSLQGLGLEEAPAAGPQEAAPGEEGLAGLKPFSVEALGLEEGAPAEEALRPFSLEELGLEETVPAKPEEGMAPFTLEELGISEVGGPPGAEGLAEMAPFSLEELGELPAEAEVRGEELAVIAPAEDVLRPFSLEELGLTTEEMAAMGLGEGAAPAGAPAVPAGEEVLLSVEAVPAEVPAAVEEVAPAVAEELAAVQPEAAAAAAPGAPSLEELRFQVTAQPNDEKLLLQLARACEGQGQYEEAFDQYKRLIKTGKASVEEALLGDLRGWIDQEQDQKRLHRLHRLLGDAYMKRGWYQQAISEYAWVLSKQ